ncbi:glycosyltransferase family 2 protein [Candidatus Shapirobacteria bacterium]|nr:glycosyltransferase family 2 protein [Candidatus Shapirobacteria bacterium]
MKLSVIILSYNTKDLLRNCLESISAKTCGLEHEVIVVDNGSTDGSREYLKRCRPACRQGRDAEMQRLKVIFNKTNLGFAKGNNVGIMGAKGDYILLLNSDTLIVDGALSKLVNFMETHAEVAVVGPRLLNKDGSFQASVGRFPSLPVVFWMLFKEHFGGSEYVRRSPAEGGEVDWVMGAALMARHEVFKKVGFLDEKIFMYMEEVEWCYRAKKAGFKIYFYPDAQIIHLWQGSSQTGRKDPILNIYRGLTYFYQKHRNALEFFILRLLLKLKAIGAIAVGYSKNSQYLKETYREAYKLA